MARFMVTAREYFDLAAVVADASRPEITSELIAYHEWKLGPAAPGRPRGWRARQQGIDPRAVGLPDDVDEAAPEVVARADWGQWIGDCPDCRASAFLLGPGPEEPYLCASCFNGTVGYRYRRCVWPRDLAEIDAVLLERPIAETRGWDPRAGETLAVLLRENVEHGVPVPRTLAHLLDAGDGAVRPDGSA